MTAPRTPAASRLVGLSIPQRLMLGLAPSLLAIVLVVGLAYYGEIGREVPAYIVVGAAVLAASSLIVTWSNARYLARRIRRLAGGVEEATTADDRAPSDDELGRIEQVVSRLGEALANSEAERRTTRAQLQATLQQQSTMLGASVRDAIARVDDVRLPLQILVDAPFGDLNENQEELLVTARAAAEAIDGVLRRLLLVTDVDRDALPVLLERVSVNDLLRGVLPMLRALTDRRGARLETDLDPALPRVAADRARLAEVVALLGSRAAQAAGDARALRVNTDRDGDRVRIRITPAPGSDPDEGPTWTLAERLLTAQGGTLVRAADGIEIRLSINGAR